MDNLTSVITNYPQYAVSPVILRLEEANETEEANGTKVRHRSARGHTIFENRKQDLTLGTFNGTFLCGFCASAVQTERFMNRALWNRRDTEDAEKEATTGKKMVVDAGYRTANQK
jgi:hypothetical protein